MSGTYTRIGCSNKSTNSASVACCFRSDCITIQPGQTLTIDTLDFSQFRCLDYFLCIDKGSSFDPKTINMKVWHNDTRVCDQVYTRNRGPVSVEVTAIETGTTYELQVTNNESTDINVKYTRQTL